MKSVKPYVSQQMLKVIYYFYFHSIMSYGVLFWGYSTYSIRAFRLQKRIIRITMGCRSRDSCRKLFIKLKILPLSSFYVLSLLCFVVNNKELFTKNNESHDICTRQHLDLYQPSATLSKYQKGVHYMGIKIFNTLPVHIKQESNNPKKFDSILKKYYMRILFILWKNCIDC